MGKFRISSRTKNYEQSNSVLDNRITLIRLVSNASIVREGNPTSFANFCKPFWVGSFCIKVICMKLHCEPSGPKNTWKLLAKIAIGKVDKAQAARS